MIGCFKFKLTSLLLNRQTNANILTLEIDKDSSVAVRQLANELDSNKTYYAEISNPKRKRTLDQNAYMWVLCQRISEAIGGDKDNIYRNFIKRVGQFKMMCVQDKDVEDVINSWSHLGIGWFCETDISQLPGCTNIMAYKGTSIYTTAEMKLLLDEVISECKELNISTIVNGYKEDK